jgi:hypothetical protein
VTAARRIGWIGVDQAVSSASNAGLSLLVARAVPADSFGAFAVAFTLYTSLLGISQAAGGAPFAVRCASKSRREARVAIAGATAWPVAFGVACGAVTVVAGVTIGGMTGLSLVAAGVFLPALFLQDCWRLILITLRRPAAAAFNDSAWAVVQFVLLGLLVAGHVTRPWAYVAAWGVAAAVGGGIGFVQLRAAPSLRSGLAWLREHRDLSVYIGAEWVTVLGASQLTILVLGVVAGLSSVGSIRGSLTLLGPLSVLAMTLSNFATPEIARVEVSARSAMRIAGGISLALVLVVVAWGAVLLLLPNSAGRWLLGDTWPGVRGVLVPMIAWQAGNMANFGPYALLRGLARPKQTLIVNLVLTPLLFVGGIVGALVAGAAGAATGLAIATWLVSPLWIRQVRQASREGRLVASRPPERVAL